MENHPSHGANRVLGNPNRSRRPKRQLLRPGVNGGIYKKQVPESKPLNYSAVESISDFLTKIEKLGGKVSQPKQEVPEIGWIDAAEDPEGNIFALIQPIRV